MASIGSVPAPFGALGSRIAARSRAAVTLTLLPICSVARITASTPSSARTWRIASGMLAALNVLRRIYALASDLAHGADLRLGMDLVLRHDHGGGPEAFDNRANEGANAGAGQQHGTLAHDREALEGLAHDLNELLQLSRRHNELAFF